MKKMNKKGFTIVELVIVIAVIAILAAVMVPTFSGVVDKANDSARVQTASALYKQALIKVLEDGVITDGETAAIDGVTFTFATANSTDASTGDTALASLTGGAAKLNGYKVSVVNGVVSVTK